MKASMYHITKINILTNCSPESFRKSEVSVDNRHVPDGSEELYQDKT